MAIALQLMAIFNHQRHFGRLFLSLACFYFALQSTLFATVVMIDDLPVMTKKSDIIIHAKVIDQKTKEDVEGRIITLTTLEVLEGLKGAKKGDVKTVYQVGGRLNGRVLRVSGAHTYKLGEELVLFGLPLDGMIVSYGVGLGKFRVLREKKGARVVEDLHDLVVVKAGRSPDVILGEPVPRQYPTLDEFKNAIYQSVYAPKGVIQKKTKKLKNCAKKAVAQ